MLVANLETATATRAYAIVRFCAVASELHSATDESQGAGQDISGATDASVGGVNAVAG
jgi:hypothetical protein